MPFSYWYSASWQTLWCKCWGKSHVSSQKKRKDKMFTYPCFEKCETTIIHCFLITKYGIFLKKCSLLCVIWQINYWCFWLQWQYCLSKLSTLYWYASTWDPLLSGHNLVLMSVHLWNKEKASQHFNLHLYFITKYFTLMLSLTNYIVSLILWSNHKYNLYFCIRIFSLYKVMAFKWYLHLNISCTLITATPYANSCPICG